MSVPVVCTNCRRPFPDEGLPFRCPTCGGLYDYTGPLAYDPARVDKSRPGIWPYAHSFGLPPGAPEVTLGEGSAPLVWAAGPGERPVAYKVEGQNPTGSFKDRGSAVLVSLLRARGVTQAAEDSSGNAGASLAAYAGRAGVRARIFVPDSAGGPKRAQIEAYGAEVVRIMGPRSNAAEAVLRAAQEGVVYASHAYLPFLLAGYATVAYELLAQLGQTPGAVVVPAGYGNLLLGIGRGFAALRAAGVIAQLPMLVGVQPRACAPLWAVFHYAGAGLGWVTEGDTLAEGTRITHPLRGDAVLQMVMESGGTFAAVDEEEILPARDALARQGLYVEPTSAMVWSALAQLDGQLPEPVVAVLTGSGLKTALPGSS